MMVGWTGKIREGSWTRTNMRGCSARSTSSSRRRRAVYGRRRQMQHQPTGFDPNLVVEVAAPRLTMRPGAPS
ncbi:Hypothetical protein MexAM1_META2p0608 (plasmid) [Methylorubrum extorquens AM1]|uniref:Uncharacterized protein n=1 Tax=Methylorubrum extorquens (strain ATCC 14718 / DSM 1338 / JCM 2805 / NCIMB 9133 / AM1) TaxID=272630 RepID=C5B4S3_METEA|nr:Hypothetical protein MexAM1_META2p0608 [Methylorubrum extorquens AM1]